LLLSSGKCIRIAIRFPLRSDGQIRPESVMVDKWLVQKSSIEIRQLNPR
jgi:hypothetical protein